MRLFVSYAHVDGAILQEWLITPLRSSGHEVWLDEQLRAGQNWREQLHQAIAQSDALIYAVSPESIASEICQWEVQEARHLGKPIIPVLIQAGTPLPAWLAKLQYVDFSQGATRQAIARLLGSLNQVPNSPSESHGAIPPKRDNLMIKLLSHPAFQGFIGIVGILIALIALNAGNNAELSTPTATAHLATPATPLARLVRDAELRSGPSADFERLDILPAESEYDILGISTDRTWYQVLLLDGRTGWILASERVARLEGNRSILRVLTSIPSATASQTPPPTETSSHTPTVTSTLTPTSTPSPSVTPSPTLTQTAHPTEIPSHTPSVTPSSTPTETFTPSPTPSATITPPPTLTFTPSHTPTITPSKAVTSTPIATATVAQVYPCTGTIITTGEANSISVVRSQPSGSSTLLAPIRVGTQVQITERRGTVISNSWYRILTSSGSLLGWIPVSYVSPSANCPR